MYEYIIVFSYIYVYLVYNSLNLSVFNKMNWFIGDCLIVLDLIVICKRLKM